MKKLKSLVIVTLLLVSICCSFGRTTARVNDKDKASIEQIVKQYVKTIEDDDTLLVNEIWSHADDVSFIGPSGRYSTYNEIRRDFVHGVFGTKFKERHLNPESLSISVCGDMAWDEFSWKFNAVANNGTPLHSKGMETQIFRKEHGKWKLVHVHYSGVQVNK